MLAALQKKLNEAMRIVTRRRWNVVGSRLTTMADLLRHCGYLSIRQMAYFHSVALAHKVLVHQAPVHLHQILCQALASGVQHHYETRAAAAGTRTVAPARLATANSSWRWRAAAHYAALPEEMRREGNMKIFQAALRRHTLRTVAI